MSDSTLQIRIKITFPILLGISILLHLLILAIAGVTYEVPTWAKNKTTPLKIHTLGSKTSKSKNSVFVEPTKSAKPLSLSDLTAAQSDQRGTKEPQVAVRPGQSPQRPTALSGLRYGADDFKKMAQEPMLQGAANVLNSKKIALNFELPEGKKLDELNEAELKLYSFLRRGAMKYVASLSSELKDWELKNPHLSFPLTEDRQTMTGRLTYDGQGNLKQIKMVRWTNVDKLQGFFENVLKRLDTLQNPPKELWVDNGEFTIFVTLQING